MLNYTTDGQPLGTNSTLWSRDPLRPLVPYALTPFSASVLTEISSVAWYRYYDRSGYTLPYPPKVIRLYQGRAYLNLSIMGKHDADHAGIEPFTIRVDDRTLPASPYEKPSMLAAIKNNRNRRKIDDLLTTLAEGIDAISERARQWLDKVEAITQWSQAEILQIMEEIERKGVDSLMAFFAARHNLEIDYNWLLRATEASHPFPSNLILVNNALSDLDGLIEVEVAQELLRISQLAAKDPVAHAWLDAGDFDQWQSTLPQGQFGDEVRALIKRYGHRGTGEGEMSILRWQEDPAPLLGGMRACLLYQAKSPATVPSSQHLQKLVEAVGGKQAKEVEQHVKRAREMLCLQSQALDAYAYILMGTRIWVQEAAKEAMHDGRMLAVEDAFFYELEEIKQMMTGEWNISAREEILAVAAGTSPPAPGKLGRAPPGTADRRCGRPPRPPGTEWRHRQGDGSPAPPGCAPAPALQPCHCGGRALGQRLGTRLACGRGLCHRPWHSRGPHHRRRSHLACAHGFGLGRTVRSVGRRRPNHGGWLLGHGRAVEAVEVAPVSPQSCKSTKEWNSLFLVLFLQCCGENRIFRISYDWLC